MKKHILRHKRNLIGGTIGVIIIAGYAWYALGASETGTYMVQLQEVKQATLASGTITSQSLLALGFKNAGNLQAIKVKVGDHIKVGTVLAMLNQQDASAAVTQAKASVAMAKAGYQK